MGQIGYAMEKSAGTQEHQNLIGGLWCGPSGGDTLEIRSPAEQRQVLGVFPSSTPEDAYRGIAAAREAFPAWANMPAPERGAILDKTSQIIGARLEDIATALTREEGKTLPEARAEVRRARDLFHYFGGEGWRMGGDVLPSTSKGELLYTRREPVGVIGVITPWNFPVAIPTWKIAPALAYGNTVVFKPASLTPISGLMVVEALVEAGLPPGVVNFISGSGRQVGQAIAASPYLDAITFTGSYEIGCGIYAQAFPNMTRVQLEMGGKNPLIVLSDARLDLAVELTVRGGFGLTGQACTATSRVIVEESIADDFAEGITAAARSLVVGNGLDEKSQMGPAISQDQLDRDLRYIQIGKEEGAELLTGGGAISGDGFFIQPTVFDQVDTRMRIAQEEIFGPVIGIIRAKDFEDAIQKANDTDYGLSAGIVTDNLAKALDFAIRINAGVVKVNEPTSGIGVNAPFGGFRHSSANTFKEQGKAAIEFYTRTKTVYMGRG